MPWAQLLRDFAARLHWTAGDVLDGTTWAELYYVWLGGSGLRVGADEGNADLKAQINRRRAAKGLPPMKPAPKAKRR